jgi:TonB-linked SusC/RagA family outer membrane protein
MQRKTLRFLIVVCLLFSIGLDNTLMGQIITGKVSDETGSPLPGVNILAKGTQSGTLTDVDGNYTLNASNSEFVVFSFIGYKTREVKIQNQKVIDVTLETDNQSLDEVVVVGFGTQKKITTVGAQSTIKPEELKLPLRNLNTVLLGRISGVVGVQRSGEPGNDNAEIFIRGIATLDKGLSQPLVLVDGVERPMNDIDPEDIASFSMLKDASATAVYGVRGANGVIIITTKKGTIGKPQIRFRYNEGVTTFTKLPDLADGLTYMRLSNEASTTRGGNPNYTASDIEKTFSQEDPYMYPNVDWYDAIFNKFSSNRNANLNISGGNERATYYVSAGYYSEAGILKTDALSKYNSKLNYDRYNFTSNLTINASQTTKLELGIQGNVTDRTLPGAENPSTIFGYVMAIPSPFHPVRYPDRLAGTRSTVIINPYNALTQRGYRSIWSSRLLSNLRVTQQLSAWVTGLSASGMFSFDALNNHSINRTKDPDRYQAIGRDEKGDLLYEQTFIGSEYLGYSASSSGERQFYNEASLNYANNFGRHEVGGLLLYNQRDYITTGGDLISSLPQRARGIAARVNYAYSERYLAEVNFGYNGSENFAAGKRYGFFPSLGLGWVPSEEKFFDPIKNSIQFLKVRFSHGLVGNSNIGGRRFAYIGTTSSPTGYTFGDAQTTNAYAGRDVGEYPVDVTWETSKKTNLGFELHTLNNSLNLQVDLFKEHREGIFLRRNSLPSYTGILLAPYGNVGIVKNKGVEVTTSYNSKLGKVLLQIQGNLTYAKNEIINNDEPPKAYPWMSAIRQKTTQTYGYEAIGLFKDSTEITESPMQTGDVRPGDIRFRDLNNDGVINQFDVKPIGYGDIPEIIYGFGVTATYKRFTLGAFFQGASRVSVVMQDEGFVPFQAGSERGNLFEVANNRWTPQNPDPNAFYPRLSFGLVNENYKTNSWFVRNTSYLRLKTFQAGYDLPEKLLKSIGVQKSRLFFIGYNLLTFSKFNLWDVELGSGRGTNYPNMKTFSLGVDLNF